MTKPIVRRTQVSRKQLEKLLHESYLALLVVKAGIWRNKEMNACGLSGAAVAVHAVESAVEQIEAVALK